MLALRQGKAVQAQPMAEIADELGSLLDLADRCLLLAPHVSVLCRHLNSLSTTEALTHWVLHEEWGIGAS